MKHKIVHIILNKKYILDLPISTPSKSLGRGRTSPSVQSIIPNRTLALIKILRHVLDVYIFFPIVRERKNPPRVRTFTQMISLNGKIISLTGLFSLTLCILRVVLRSGGQSMSTITLQHRVYIPSINNNLKFQCTEGSYPNGQAIVH